MNIIQPTSMFGLSQEIQGQVLIDICRLPMSAKV